MRKLWLLYAIVSVADLVLSGLYLNPSLEANPIASWIWSTLGYQGLILYKVLIVCGVVYPCVSAIEKKEALLARVMLLFGTLATGAVCLLFGVGLL